MSKNKEDVEEERKQQAKDYDKDNQVGI